MRTKLAAYYYLAILLAILNGSCTKEDQKIIAPAINFKSGENYTYDGEVVEVGRKLIFGVQARGNTSNINNFTIKKMFPDGKQVTMMDTGMNSINLNIDKTFYQNVEDTAVWTFTVMDRDRMMNSISMSVFKDPNSQFGGIYYHPKIKVGYQKNTEFGQFLDPVSGKTYFEDSASMNQAAMEFLFYHILDVECRYLFSDKYSPYSVYSLRAEKKIIQSLFCSLTVDNIFNTIFTDSSARKCPGRFVMAAVRFDI